MNMDELMKDEGFAREMEQTRDVAELTALLNRKGVEIGEDELQKALDAAELGEEDLENVAGGLRFPLLPGPKRRRIRIWDPFRRRWVYIYVFL